MDKLLERASASSGATMLIPDLQRPYLWKPYQVTLLIDSLIRGWPFGTLLLWRVNHKEVQGIPFRPFWTVCDRTTEADGAHVAQMNPPADYHMVLDGQQRVQSLLLALQGDDWGFKLEDRDWNEEVKEQRPRGRQTKYRHWSKASLCFDLDKFLLEYERHDGSLLAVDFRGVLTWAVTDPQGGQSNFPKANDEGPLPKAYAQPSRLIRLSRLWKEAPPNPALHEAQFRNLVKPLLAKHGVAPEKIDKLLPPMGELMTTLRDVKLADVTFLELQPFDEKTWTHDTYNDAVVNIFTRLNSAGRILSREEITLAWLKVGWTNEETGGKSAGQCFAELDKDLREYDLSLEVDELVNAASFVWSVSNKDGRLLSDPDLLKGDVIRPMALVLSKRWNVVQKAFTTGAKALEQRGIAYGPRGHFSSLYALEIFWAWVFAAETWKANQPLGELQTDDFEKKCSDSVNRYLDRWIMCSQWAGVWSGSSSSQIEVYAKALADLIKALDPLKDTSEAHKVWDDCFKGLVDSLSSGASANVANMSAPSRERVSLYRNLLWIWHRLDSDRWDKSKVQLRVGKSRVNPEVDHIVPVALWKRKIQSVVASQPDPMQPTAKMAFGNGDEADSQFLINRLGNCALLEKNFNISKGDKTLKFFLTQIHEVKQKKISIDAWCAALSIPKPILDPDAANADEISNAIDARDSEMRDELADFIRGQKVRVDVYTPVERKVVQPAGATTEAAPSTGDATPSTEEANVHSASGADVDHSAEEATDTPQSATPRAGADMAGLRAAYREDPELRLIVDHFGSRQRNQHQTDINAFVRSLGRADTPVARSAVLRAFRRLDALGVGRFILGRRGQETRFEWYQKSLSVRDLAAEDKPVAEAE